MEIILNFFSSQEHLLNHYQQNLSENFFLILLCSRSQLSTKGRPRKKIYFQLKNYQDHLISYLNKGVNYLHTKKNG